MKLKLFFILSIFSTLCFAGQIPVDAGSFQSKRSYLVQFDNALLEYKVLREQPDIKRHIELHNKIFDIVIDIYVNREFIKEPLWREDYKKMGIFIGHYGSIVYYDKLLAEAHKINPHSSLRKYTLYSEVFSQYTSHSWSAMPNVKAAEVYLKEFPKGPYAWKANEALGYFYYDLYKVFKDAIENIKLGRSYVEHTHDCYKNYILDKPFLAQMKAAKLKSTWYLKKSLKLKPKSVTQWDIKAAIDDMDYHLFSGSSGVWYYCAD